MGELILPEPNILGDHQLYNISTSIAASRKIFNVKDQDIKLGIQNISLKGRLQEIKSGKLKALVKDYKLFTESIRSLLLRQVKMKHPLQEKAEKTKTTKREGKDVYAITIDYKKF